MTSSFELELVFDAEPLENFARVGALEHLANLVEGRGCWTPATFDAVARDAAVVAGVSDLLATDFLREFRLEDLESLRATEQIRQALGGPASRPLARITQASTLVAARHAAGVAVLDDKTARRFARATDIRLSGSVGLVKAMVSKGQLAAPQGLELLVSICETTGLLLPNGLAVTDLEPDS